MSAAQPRSGMSGARHAAPEPPYADADAAVHRIPGLGGLSTYTRRRLLERGRGVHIPQGWTPVHAGEPADKAYLVLEGSLRVVRGDQEVAVLGPGCLAGEMGLVDHRLRNARLTATEPVRALAWPRDAFLELRDELPDFEALVQQVAQGRHEDNRAP